MKTLSRLLDPKRIQELRRQCEKGLFPGVDFENAMAFFLTDGVIPKTDLPPNTFLQLEDWIRQTGDSEKISFTATELKNKTGLILEIVMQGREVTIVRHGRPIASLQAWVSLR